MIYKLMSCTSFVNKKVLTKKFIQKKIANKLIKLNKKIKVKIFEIIKSNKLIFKDWKCQYIILI